MFSCSYLLFGLLVYTLEEGLTKLVVTHKIAGEQRCGWSDNMQKITQELSDLKEIISSVLVCAYYIYISLTTFLTQGKGLLRITCLSFLLGFFLIKVDAHKGFTFFPMIWHLYL